MAAMKHRLRKLEGVRQAPPAPGGRISEEIRAIDRNIARLGAEIKEAQAGMSPEELAESQAETRQLKATLSGMSLDEGIAFLTAKIAEEENR